MVVGGVVVHDQVQLLVGLAADEAAEEYQDSWCPVKRILIAPSARTDHGARIWWSGISAVTIPYRS